MGEEDAERRASAEERTAKGSPRHKTLTDQKKQPERRCASTSPSPEVVMRDVAPFFAFSLMEGISSGMLLPNIPFCFTDVEWTIPASPRVARSHRASWLTVEGRTIKA